MDDESANDWTRRKIREAFRKVKPVSGRLSGVPHVQRLEREIAELRDEIERLRAREARLAEALGKIATGLDECMPNEYENRAVDFRDHARAALEDKDG